MYQVWQVDRRLPTEGHAGCTLSHHIEMFLKLPCPRRPLFTESLCCVVASITVSSVRPRSPVDAKEGSVCHGTSRDCKLNQGAAVKTKLTRSLPSLGDLPTLGTGTNISPALHPIFGAHVGGRGSCPHCAEGELRHREWKLLAQRPSEVALAPRELQVCASPLWVVMATTWLVGLNRRRDYEHGEETKRQPTQ